MSARMSPGPLFIDSDDMQFAVGTRAFGLKIDYINQLGGVRLCERIGSAWQSVIVLDEWDGNGDTPQARIATGVDKWVSTVIKPKLQAYLTEQFPAAGTPAPPPGSAMTDAQACVTLNQALFGLRVVRNANGTVSVV